MTNHLAKGKADARTELINMLLEAHDAKELEQVFLDALINAWPRVFNLEPQSLALR